MSITKLSEKKYQLVALDIRKKVLTEEQVKASFKRIYGKEPTIEEFRQYKLFNQGKI